LVGFSSNTLYAYIQNHLLEERREDTNQEEWGGYVELAGAWRRRDGAR
jgi:nitrogen fixation protein